MKNPNCDGSNCKAPIGKVKLLPLGSSPHHGNLILCHSCWKHELEFRRERNLALARSFQFDIPKWETLKTYLP